MPKVFVPSPNTLECVVRYWTYGGFAVNVYHVQGNAVVQDLAATAARIMDAFHAWETASMRQFRSIDNGFHDITVRDIGQQNGPSWQSLTTIQGTAPGEAMPDNVTLAVKWLTNRGGRSFRGRTYHVGMPKTMVDRDQMTQPSANNLAAAYNALIAAIHGSGWSAAGDTGAQLVVCSKYANKAPRAQAVCTPIVAAGLVDNNLDSQRRRLVGRGT